MAGDTDGVRRLVDRPHHFRQWRDASVFGALLEGLITETTKRGEVDLSLVSIDSTTARAHHDAAGLHLDEDVVTALEKAAAEEEKVRPKGAASKCTTGKRPKVIPRWKNDDASGVGRNSR